MLEQINIKRLINCNGSGLKMAKVLRYNPGLGYKNRVMSEILVNMCRS